MRIVGSRKGHDQNVQQYPFENTFKWGDEDKTKYETVWAKSKI